MFPKIVSLLAIACSVLAAEFTLKLEADSAEMDSSLSTDSISNSVADSTTSSSRDGELTNAEAGTPGTNHMVFANEGLVLVPMSASNELHLSVDRTPGSRPGVDNVRLSVSSSGANGFQILDPIDRLRDSLDEVPVRLPIDPRTLPQNQIVDNTIRLMAIKNSVDELAKRVLPNPHVGLQHVLEDRL